MYVYEDHMERRRCNWAGRLTCGTIFFRGTRVVLLQAGGCVLAKTGAAPYFLDHVKERNRLANSDAAYWDHPGELRMDLDRRNFEDDNVLVSCDRLKHPEEFDDLEWALAPYANAEGAALLQSALDATYAGQVVLHNAGTLHFIHDYAAFWHELRRVKEWARRECVSFEYW